MLPTVRLLHVLAMAIMLGGALVAARVPSAARAYEALFWGAIGVSVATGVGNLGEKGQGLPAPATSWGATLTWKLVLVAALLLFSAARTLIVVKGRARPALHWATAGALAVIVALAEVLAHG